MVVYYNEFDPKAAAWLRELIAKGLIADGVVDTRSIEDVEPRQLAGFTQCHFFAGIGVWSYALRQAGVSDDTPVWTGSCPCQPFSAAGKGGGFDDERHLWPAWQWLIQQRRPELIIGEQVASKDAEPWLDLVQADLEGLDYAFGACAFPSAGVGAPHIRDRTYWVADNQIGGRREKRADFGRKPSGDGTQGNAAGSEHGCSAGGLADDDDARLEGRGQPGRERGTERAAGPGGLAGGLADADSAGQFEHAERHSKAAQPRQQASQRHDNGGRSDDTRVAGHADPHGAGDEREHGLREVATHAGPVNGGWGNADWIYCRNGEWRPVEPSYVKMVDGSTGSVGYLRTGDDSKEEINAGRVLQALREGADAKAIWQALGGLGGVQSPEVLRPFLHGLGLRGADKESDAAKLAASIGETPSVEVHGLREDKGAAAQSSHEPEPIGERRIELGDVVRSLSHDEALAELRSDYRTAVALSLLRCAIAEESNVFHASEPLEKAWASLGEEGQNKIRLDFETARWERVYPFPLVHGARSRVARLRGYGNAINAEAATIFIQSYLEARG